MSKFQVGQRVRTAPETKTIGFWTIHPVGTRTNASGTVTEVEGRVCLVRHDDGEALAYHELNLRALNEGVLRADPNCECRGDGIRRRVSNNAFYLCPCVRVIIPTTNASDDSEPLF